MPKKICLAPSCNNLVEMKEKYCSSCQPAMKEVKRDKNRKYDQFVREADIVEFYYSSEWKRVREAALIRDDYLCQHYIKNNTIKSTEIVHHIVEIRTDRLKGLISVIAYVFGGVVIIYFIRILFYDILIMDINGGVYEKHREKRFSLLVSDINMDISIINSIKDRG